MKTLSRVLLCLWPVVLLLTSSSFAENGTKPDAMPRSAAWRESTVITVGDSKDVKVSDYVVSDEHWAVTMVGKRKTVAGKLDGAVFPKSKAASVEAVSPAAILPFVFSMVKDLKEKGKLHPESDELLRREPSQGELEKEGDKFRIRYDEGLSFPKEFTIWRKNGETTVITYSKFRKIDVAASRAEIVGVLAPIRKVGKR